MMKKMRWVGALAISSWLVTNATAQEKQDAKEAKPIEASKTQPYKLGSVVDENLTLTDLDGNELKLKDLRGKVVLIHFWSTTCPYEVVADPKFTELAKRWRDNQDVVILAINANQSEIGAGRPSDGYAAVREHMKKKQLSFPVYADHGNRVADLFQAQSTPHCLWLGPFAPIDAKQNVSMTSPVTSLPSPGVRRRGPAPTRGQSLRALSWSPPSDSSGLIQGTAR